MATWKKTPLVNTVKATSGSTYTTGSSSVGYYGCDKDDKYVADNACALVFDTSDYPSDSILKYKQCTLKLHVNTTNKHGWLLYTDGDKLSVNYPEYKAYANSVEVEANTVASKSYKWLCDNWTAQANALGVGDGSDAVFDASLFHHKTMVLFLKKVKVDSDSYYCSRVSQSGTYLELTYEDIKPEAVFNYKEGNFYRAKTYTVNWNYKDSKSRGQVAWKLEWISSTGQTGIVTGTKESTYTFPAYTFPAGNIVFKFSVKSGGDGVWSPTYTTINTVTAVNSEPTVKATGLIDGVQAYRALEQTFKWDYSDTASVPQTEYKIDWSCAGATGTTDKISSANKYHIFPAYTFPIGEVTYYVTVWNKDGFSAQAGPYTLTAINSIPTVEVTSPVENEDFNHYSELKVQWDYTDPASVEQKKYQIDYTSGETSGVVTGNADKYHIFPKGLFNEGKIIYYLTVWNKDGESVKVGPYYANCVLSVPTVTAAYPVAVSVQKSRSFTYSWNFDETYETGQKSWILEVTQNGVITTYSGTTETSFTIPAYTYDKGKVIYSITVTNNDGKTATTGNITFNVEPSYPNIELVYPNSVLVKGSDEQIFTWNYSETVDVGQIQYWIELTHDGITTEYTEISSVHYHIFAPNTLPNGSSSFIIKVLNADGEYDQIGPFVLTVVSETAAPDIVSVNNDAKPTIVWDTYSQDGFELIITDNYHKVIYESGLVIGSDTREYQVPTLLSNGRYLIQLRVQNEYGYYTPYATKYVEISAKCQSTIEDVSCYNTAEYGIAIEAQYSGGIAYVIRRNPTTGEEKNLGEYISKYVDYTLPANTNMQYCIRLYDGGVVDSAWSIGFVEIKEVLIRNTLNAKDYVVLDLTDTENFNIYHSDVREKSKIKVLGRAYSVMESSEWMTTTRKFRAHTTEEQFVKLMQYAVSGNPIRYQAEKESFLADIEIMDEGKYVGGRMVSVTITRIDDGGE